MYQKCPVCDGYGVVNYPAGTAAGQQWSGTSVGPWPCRRCSGQGTILSPDEKPRCPDCGKTDGWFGVHICNTSQS